MASIFKVYKKNIRNEENMPFCTRLTCDLSSLAGEIYL